MFRLALAFIAGSGAAALVFIVWAVCYVGARNERRRQRPLVAMPPCDICGKPTTISIRETLRKYADYDTGCWAYIMGDWMHFCDEHDPREITP